MKKEPLYIVDTNVNGCSHHGKSMESSQKHSKTELSYNPAILDIFPKKTQALTQKNICNSMFIIPLFIIAKIWGKT